MCAPGFVSRDPLDPSASYSIFARLMFLTTHVTVCVCHAELKGYLLTYLLT